MFLNHNIQDLLLILFQPRKLMKLGNPDYFKFKFKECGEKIQFLLIQITNYKIYLLFLTYLMRFNYLFWCHYLLVS